MAHNSILLKSGTVLFHSSESKDDHVTPLLETDVLIEGNLVKEIGKDLKPLQETEVVDCVGKIISPGQFINTHHHLWQTQLKGRHAEHTLIDYMHTGNMASFGYTATDVYWGQLSGCLESLNAGTTTVLDHSHAAYTPAHAVSALSASASSGIRSIFAYMTHFLRLQEWNKNTIRPQSDFIPEWPFEQIETLCKLQPFGSGRINIGFAFDYFFLPPDKINSTYERMRSAGVKLITSHVVNSPALPKSSATQTLKSINQLRGTLVFSHCNNLDFEDYTDLAKAEIGISTTPFTEYQMGMTNSVVLNQDIRYPHTSLGVDCHSNNTSSMPMQARTSLLTSRAMRADRMYNQGVEPRSLLGSTHEAFNLITIKGARALGMEKEIGSIAVGKKADIVVFDAMGPNMLCAAEEDPVVAVVNHSDAGDVQWVIVDGIIRKRDGKLCAVDSNTDVVEGTGEQMTMEWLDVVRKVAESRKEVLKKLGEIGPEKGRELLIQSWHIDESKMVD